jgi:hypothetical protein
MWNLPRFKVLGAQNGSYLIHIQTSHQVEPNEFP